MGVLMRITWDAGVARTFRLNGFSQLRCYRSSGDGQCYLHQEIVLEIIIICHRKAITYRCSVAQSCDIRTVVVGVD